MDVLAGYGSDSSSSSSNKEFPMRSKSTLIGLLGSPLSGSDDDDEIEASRNRRKRRKVLNDDGIEAFENILPSPPTTVAGGKSIVHLNEDYLSPMLKSLHFSELSKNVSAPNLLAAQARKLKSTSESATGQVLAMSVRSQKDYYNPLFFQILRDRFNVEVPLQSRTRLNSNALKEYEHHFSRKDTT